MFKRMQVWFPIVLLLGLLFIALGDLLPPPLSTASRTTRNNMDQFIAGLFPSWRPKTQPYDRTERALENEQGGQKP